MARPRKLDPETALARALEAFRAKGYAGTSLADLVAATGLNKGSLYAAFGDKRQLYLAAIARYERDAVDTAVAALRGAADPRAAIAALLDGPIAAVARGDRRGCLLCNAAIDRASDDQAVARRVLSALARLQRGLVGALKRGYPHDAASEIEACASHVLATYMGLCGMARAGVAAAELRAIAIHAVAGALGAATAGRAPAA
jgi:TetR/AcrR family transcriptional repressor of nem operon